MPPPRAPRAPRLQLEIDEDLIDQSTQRHSGHCMIAEAVKVAYPNARRVSVDLQTIRFSDYSKGLRYTYLTPRVGQVALVKFDQGMKPEPFAVQLRNGQVTAAATGQVTLKQPRSAAQKAQTTKAQQRANTLRKAKLSAGTSGTNKGSVPDKIGGRTPPTAPLGQRRSFGLRALEL